MIRTLATLLLLSSAAHGAAACEEARGGDARFAEAALATAQALASETCDKPLYRRFAASRYWRPEPGFYMREEIWAFGPEDTRGTCYVDAAANEAGTPDQIILRCRAAYRCPDGSATEQEPTACERAE